MYAPSKRRRFPAIIALLLILVCYILWASLPSLRSGWVETDVAGVTLPASKHNLPCHDLPGANETLVVLKTGATELEDKLPVHLNTTVQCYPNLLIFSDTAGTVHDHLIIDALEPVSPTFKETHPDFELYRQLRDYGMESQSSDRLHGEGGDTSQESGTGHAEIPGWKLDKWKFLPMVNRTFHEYPTMKWYVFIEADTYILWASLLEHFSGLDDTRPYYAGVRVFIGDVGFAHGGSGFIVSQPAMRLAAEYINAHQHELEEFTENHWAGDCVLGKTFMDAGVELTDAWPIIQGDYPGMVPYIAPDGRPMPPSEERIWCNTAVSYHHVPPTMIKDFWHFEQQWLSEVHEGRPKSLRHSDVFREFIMPRIQSPRLEWDNESGDDVGSATSFDTCQTSCEANSTCVQYAFESEGRCRHFHLPRLGKSALGVQSGWVVGRLEALIAAVAPCSTNS